MAAAAKALMAADMDGITRHESALTAYALDRLRSLPAVTVYGPNDPGGGDRVGVIAFNRPGSTSRAGGGDSRLRGGDRRPKRLLLRAAIRDAAPADRAIGSSRAGIASTSPAIDRRKPGMVRISLGAYNVREDIDDLVAMLRRIAQHQYEGRYIEVPEHGNYRAAGDAGALVRCV